MSPNEQPTIPHISVSAITTYLRCPRQYEHRYFLKTPPAFRPGNLAFGSAIHSALNVFYSHHMIGMPEPTPDELIAEFSEAWHRETNSDVPLLLDDGENEEQLTNKGAAMLEVFHKEVQRPVTVLGVEQEFIMELQDPETGEVLPPLVGRLDALVEASDGNIVVLEHKTSSKRYSETKLRLDLQATTYSLATHTMGLEASVVFQVLLKTTKPAFEVYSVERTPLDYKYLMHTISGVLRAINANAFPPIRDWWCNGCQYALACLNR